MPSLSRYASMEVSCLLHLYQYDDATWVRPIHISAACVPGRVPVSTDPCLQASSFCRQVRDTAQLALFHVLHHVSCIVQDGEEAAYSWDSLTMPIYPSSRRRPESATELPPSKRRAAYCSVDAQIRSLGRLLRIPYIQAPYLLASTGRAGNLICSVALCNGM
ncbi:hypothetical protein V8C34DRAFT_61127 [Trichoderma compactum]